jgi:hypothetical protein
VFIFAGAKFGENVLEWDAFMCATKFRAMAIYVILFEREIIIRGLNFCRRDHLTRAAISFSFHVTHFIKQ